MGIKTSFLLLIIYSIKTLVTLAAFLCQTYTQMFFMNFHTLCSHFKGIIV